MSLFSKAILATAIISCGLLGSLSAQASLETRKEETIRKATASLVAQRTSQTVIAVGAALTPEVFQREIEVQNIVEAAHRQFKICFNNNYSTKLKETLINLVYFSVDEKGDFVNPSGELPYVAGAKPMASTELKGLHNCMYETLSYMHATPSKLGTISFRLKVAYLPPVSVF